MEWITKKFNDLSPEELYAVAKLRQDVFIIEQNCIYDDLDGLDDQAYHVSGFLNKQLVAYARIFPPGIKYEEVSIGRIVTSPSYRKQGLGKMLVKKSIEVCDSKFHGKPIKIEAQSHLQEFYKALGFIPQGDTYPVDGISHIIMIRPSVT